MFRTLSTYRLMVSWFTSVLEWKTEIFTQSSRVRLCGSDLLHHGERFANRREEKLDMEKSFPKETKTFWEG